MFKKVLIANRGEIACRVIRTLRELGISPVAVASEADARARHVRLADESRIIGPAASRESYLRADRIIEAALSTGAEAIHPGYGFLSESEALRDACDAAGIVFIGPPSHAMASMGNKTRAREVMAAAGVPIVPGTTRAAADGAEMLEMSRKIGFPVLLKAAAGGGGKGMRLVHAEADLVAAFESCTREASSAFGDGSVYVEKAIIEPRHIEIQVFADRHGHAVYLFERECSVQRRHQKVIEEAPAANLSDATRRAMGEVAVKAALAIGYEGAGTLEFLVDRDENFYFLEMNTRLQVEHPVTECITGLDLVKLQLEVAAGKPLPFTQEQLTRTGHAVECRLYAEDPWQNFMPSPGPLVRYRPPTGVGIRVDDGVEEGDEVSQFYDPMVAKIVASGPDRETAIQRMRAALRQLEVAGIRTNREFLDVLLAHPDFVAGRYSTALIGSMGPLVAPFGRTDLQLAAEITAAVLAFRENASAARFAVRGNRDVVVEVTRDATGPALGLVRVDAAGESRELTHRVERRGDAVVVRVDDRVFRFALAELNRPASRDHSHRPGGFNGGHATELSESQPRTFAFFGLGEAINLTVLPERETWFGASQGDRGGGAVSVAMPGKVVAVDVQVDQAVVRGQRLLVIEAMKMENDVKAPRDGVVRAVRCAVGDSVEAGAPLIDLS